MVKYKKVYSDHHGYGEQDVIICQYCNKEIAVDIHHILFKSRGGKDNIENLIALCRKCHNDAHCYFIDQEEMFKIVKESL